MNKLTCFGIIAMWVLTPLAACEENLAGPIHDSVAGSFLQFANSDILDAFEQSVEGRVALEQNRAFALADAEGMRDLYTSDAAVLVGPFSAPPMNVFRADGVDDIVGAFGYFMSDEGGFPRGTTVTITGFSQSGNTLFQTCEIENDAVSCQATDTYCVDGGLISRQTAYLICTPKTE